ATTLINTFGKKRVQWALVITGLIVGLAMFFEVGFVLLLPLVFPAINYRSDAVLYLDHSHEYRMVDVDKAVRKALAEGKTEISWY
ncbi:hypothetical protein ONJ23_27175, partial [Salmonella enterica subsp. enterica serovar Virginia]|nr:hypothetical protein [Salmonella enterica subsp. enterica serovar Virginia]